MGFETNVKAQQTAFQPAALQTKADFTASSQTLHTLFAPPPAIALAPIEAGYTRNADAENALHHVILFNRKDIRPPAACARAAERALKIGETMGPRTIALGGYEQTIGLWLNDMLRSVQRVICRQNITHTAWRGCWMCLMCTLFRMKNAPAPACCLPISTRRSPRAQFT